MKGEPLLLAGLLINVIILEVLATRNMEPRASVEELQAEAENGELTSNVPE